ncbi:hypothetical protein ACLKA6_014745 [Drosophila palustris]
MKWTLSFKKTSNSLALQQLLSAGGAEAGGSFSAGFKLPVSQDSCPVRAFIYSISMLATNAARTMAMAPSLFANAIHYAGHFCWPSATLPLAQLPTETNHCDTFIKIF